MLDHERNCFLVCPIGDEGTEVRQAADDLYDLVIVPSLKMFRMNVIRADMIPTPSKITNDIVELVQQSDLCVIDLTGSNPNVFYECGRRHETGKPFLQLIQKGKDLPFDVREFRTIEYDLQTPRGVHDTIETIQKFVSELEKGFGSVTRGVSMVSIGESLQRIERLLDRSLSGNLSYSRVLGVSHEMSPIDRMVYHLDPEGGMEEAIKTGDVGLARECLLMMKEEEYDDEKVFPYVFTLAALGDRKVALPLLYEILQKDSFDLFFGVTDDSTDPSKDPVKDINRHSLPSTVVGMVAGVYKILDRFVDDEGKVEILVPRIKQALDEIPTLVPRDRSSLLDYIALSYSFLENYELALEYSEKALELQPDSAKIMIDQIFYYKKLNKKEMRIQVAKRLAKQVDKLIPDYFEQTIKALDNSDNEDIINNILAAYERKFPLEYAEFKKTP